jgi:hypothetical protein
MNNTSPITKKLSSFKTDKSEIIGSSSRKKKTESVNTDNTKKAVAIY